MIKAYLNGIGFGFGFCLAVAIVAWAVSQFGEPIGERIIHSSSDQEIGYKEKNQWNDLTIDEKINKTTVVVIVIFRKEADSLNAAYIEDIVRRDLDSKLNINIGDRLVKSDFFRGVAIFAEACFGHPSPSKRQILNATVYAYGAPTVLRTLRNHLFAALHNSLSDSTPT